MSNTKHTPGEIISFSIQPFIFSNPPAMKRQEAIDMIAKPIDRLLENHWEVARKAKQLLSCIDYNTLTEYQLKVAASLEAAIKKASE